MEATNGKVLYRNGNTVVTDRQASISGTTYDLKDVAGVSFVRPLLSRYIGPVVLAVGVLLAIVGYIVWNGVFLTPMLGGVVLIVVGAILWRTVRERYTVNITQRNGQSTPLEFADPRQAQQVVEAISQAIEEKRA